MREEFVRTLTGAVEMPVGVALDGLRMERCRVE